MRSQNLIRLAALVGVFTPLRNAAAQYPTTPPPAAPITAAAFPPFQEALLANGVKLIVVQSNKQPVASISISFPAGSSYDPTAKSGVADMVAGLLTKGAGKRSAEDVAAAIEGVGGAIAASTDPDFLTVRTDLLAADAKLGFELLADAVIRPTFPEKELDLLRTQTLSALQLEQSQPASIADRMFIKGLYGDHPYGRRADPASVKAITRDDLVKFHKARLRPAGALLVVSGSLKLAEARKLATAAFAGWSGVAVSVAAAKEPPARQATEILLVHRPGSVQSNILAGNLTWLPRDPRSYAATVVNKVLGDGASGRLFMTLREAKSWTYGAYSTLATTKGQGYFVANTEVRTEVTDSALVELLAQLKRVSTEPISSTEFDAAKNSIAGSFPLGIEAASQVARQVSSAMLLGRAPNYVQTYRQKIAAVTPVAAQAAAGAAIRPAQALVVVVGDGTKIYEKLAKVATVRIVATDGTPLKPADLVVKAGALDLALDKIVARTDSFAIIVQGNPFGFQRSSLVKRDGGWVYTEDVQIASLVQQNTEVHLNANFEVTSTKQTGKQQGQDSKIDVTYVGGRAKGSSTTPAPTGPKTIAIDTELPKGTLEDNQLTMMFPAMKFAAGAKITVPVFQSGKGTVAPFTLTVTGSESVKVPAGTFDAWKVELSGGEQPTTMWLEKGTNRVVKIALAGTPIELQLVK